MSTVRQPGQRLSPFVLPSATATQFGLLVVALLGGSTFVYDYLFVIGTSRIGDTVDGCLSGAEQRIAAQAPAHTVVASYVACWNGVGRTNSLLMLAGLAGMLVVAALLYLAHPWLYRVRHRLIRVDDALAPAVAGRARDLAAAAGLRRQPTLLIRPVLDIDAYSFGLRRKYVVVYQGLLLTAKTRPQVLDAYLRHEFGHLRNGDIALTQFVLAAWRAFVLAAVVPFVVTLSARPSSITAHTVLAMALILIAVYVGTLLVLRLREHYADVRATVGDGPAGALGTLLSAASGRARTWHDTLRWRKRRHPAEPARLDVVGDPARLLHLRVLPMAVAGLSFGIGVHSFPELLSSLWLGADSRLAGLSSAAIRFAVGVLATGTVGLACWRAAATCVVDRRPLPSAVAPAAALTVGIMVGSSINDMQAGAWWGLARSDPVAGGVTAVVLFVLSLFFLQWSMACAALWLEVTPSARWRRPALWGLPVGGVLAGLLFGAWFESLHGLVTGAVNLLANLVNGQLALAAVAAVAWPMAAGLRLRRPPGPEVGLDQPLVAAPGPLSPRPVRPTVPFAAGAAAALLFIVPMLMLRDRVAEEINGTAVESMAGVGTVLAVAAILQCMAGLVAAALTGVRQATLGALHGLAAVIVAAPGMLAVLTVVLLAPVCADKPGSCLTRINSFDWHRWWLILLVGIAALVLTPLLWTVAWTARGLARLQGVAGWPQPPMPVHPRYAGSVRQTMPGPRSTGQLIIGAVGAAILLFTVALSALPPTSAAIESQESGAAAAIAEPPDRSLNSICTWLPQATLSASLSGNAADNLGPAARAVGRVVARSDDPLTRQIGEEIVAAAAAGDTDRYLVAVSALGYRCGQTSTSDTKPAG